MLTATADCLPQQPARTPWGENEYCVSLTEWESRSYRSAVLPSDCTTVRRCFHACASCSGLAVALGSGLVGEGCRAGPTSAHAAGGGLNMIDGRAWAAVAAPWLPTALGVRSQCDGSVEHDENSELWTRQL